MAFRRSLSSRATLVARRYQSSFAYIFHDDDCKTRPLNESRSQPKPGVLGQRRSFGTGYSNPSSGIGVLLQDRRCSHLAFLPSTGISFGRYISSIASDGAKEVELMTDVAEAFKDTSIEAVTQVPAANELPLLLLIVGYPLLRCSMLLTRFILLQASTANAATLGGNKGADGKPG